MKIKLLSLSICLVGIVALSSCVVPPGGVVTSSSVGLSVLPRGYNTVYVGGSPYYYSRNSWYRRSGNRYIRCARPHGYHGSIGSNYSSRYGSRYGNSYGLTRLPSGYRTIAYGGQLYFNNGSSWYRRDRGRYYSCSAPRGYHSRYGYSNSSRYRSHSHSSRYNSYSHNRNHNRSHHSSRSSSYHRNKTPSRSSVYKGDLKRATRN